MAKKRLSHMEFGREEMLPQSLRAMAMKRCSHMEFNSQGQEEMVPHRV